MQIGVGIRQSGADVDTDSLLSQNWPPSPPLRWRSCSETDSATTEKHGRKKTEKIARNAMEFLISVDLGKVWPPLIHTDRGAQFVGRWWHEIWMLLGTKLRFGTEYHPQSQGQVERMNAVVSQMLRCLMTDVPYLSRWTDYLPTVEMVVSSLRNRSTGYSPFFLMYGYHPVLPVELLKGDESTNVEALSKFL